MKQHKNNLARGTRLRELLKQPQNSPLSSCGTSCFNLHRYYTVLLDDLEVGQMLKRYCASLLSFLGTSQQEFICERL